jgi:hypothetical protein
VNVLPKLKGIRIVIVTKSGPDRATDTLNWSPTIKELLDKLLAGYTVGEAVTEANIQLRSTTDSFKIINGDKMLKII